MRARDLPDMRFADIAYVEADGGLSVNAAVLAQRLNTLLHLVQRLEEQIELSSESEPDRPHK